MFSGGGCPRPRSGEPSRNALALVFGVSGGVAVTEAGLEFPSALTATESALPMIKLGRGGPLAARRCASPLFCIPYIQLGGVLQLYCPTVRISELGPE